MKNVFWTVLGSAASLFCSCVQQELCDRSPEYGRGFRQGALEAKAEIEAGEMTNYTSGFGAQSGGHCQVTGLPFAAIADCVGDDFIEGREDGHDQLIYAELGLDWKPSAYYVFDDFGDDPK